MICPNCSDTMVQGKRHFICEECGYKIEIPAGVDDSEYKRLFQTDGLPSVILNLTTRSVVECNIAFAETAGFLSSAGLLKRSIEPKDYLSRDILDILYQNGELPDAFKTEIRSVKGGVTKALAYSTKNPGKEIVLLTIVPLQNVRGWNLDNGDNYFKAVADYTYDWEIWLAPDGGLNWVNPSSERITGFTIDECFGMENYPIPLIHNDDREMIGGHLMNARGGGFGNDIEFRYAAKDGSAGWAALSYQPIVDAAGKNLGCRASIRDINERKRLEDALRASETNYKNMADFLPSVIAEFDTALNLVYINKTGIETFQYSEDDLAGKINLVTDMVDAADRHRMEQDVQNIVRNVKLLARIYRFPVKDGTLMNAIFNVSLIKDDDELKGFRVSLVPIKSILYSIIVPDDYFYAEYKMTEREKEIVGDLVLGLKIKEIGAKRRISESTVKTHIASVYTKLKINTKDELFEHIIRYQTARFGYETLIFSLIKSIIEA